MYIKGYVQKKQQVTYTDAELEKSPTLLLNKKALNYGEAENGEVITKSITISNPGKSNLIIKDLISGCRCITYTLDKDFLQPGEEGNLILSYKPNSLGANHEVASIISNDLRNPKIDITIEVSVVKQLNSQSVLQNNQSKSPFK